MINTPVNEIMTTDLLTVDLHESVERVAQLFEEHKFHHIPVIDKSNSIKGIISLTDVERMKYGKSLFRNPDLETYNRVLFQSTLAEDIMTNKVVTLQSTDTIQRAYDYFKNNQFRALPILEGQKLVGIVTPIDLLDYFFHSTNGEPAHDEGNLIP